MLRAGVCWSETSYNTHRKLVFMSLVVQVCWVFFFGLLFLRSHVSFACSHFRGCDCLSSSWDKISHFFSNRLIPLWVVLTKRASVWWHLSQPMQTSLRSEALLLTAYFTEKAAIPQARQALYFRDLSLCPRSNTDVQLAAYLFSTASESLMLDKWLGSTDTIRILGCN